MFDALILTQEEKKTFANIKQLTLADLPEGDVLVNVQYSSLNYKDGLAITGKGKICRQFPMVPGIDFVGTVESSDNPQFKAGQTVLLTGWGVGETHWGGMAQKARVKADWLVSLSSNLAPQNAMMIGTAGLTAMLCVQALEDAGITPEKGEILVTGASGGVGSVAVTLLSKLGYQVVAVTGRASDNADWLMQLGATRVIDRSEFEGEGRPLDKQRWAGAVDTAGSKILANILSQIDYDGAVAICGLAGGYDLPTTVMPFILRGVKLLGVDSVYISRERREKAWTRIADILPTTYFEQSCTQISLNDVPKAAEQITLGQIKGRVLIAL